MVKSKAFELTRKNVFFRLSLMYLSIFTISLVSFYGCKDTSVFYSTESRSYKKMNFKFEDYDTNELKVVQSKLYQLFPKGSSVSEFRSAMEQLGAKCYTGGDRRTWEFDDDVMYCQYRFESGFLTITQWTVVIGAKDRKNISDLRVNAGIIAP